MGAGRRGPQGGRQGTGLPAEGLAVESDLTVGPGDHLIDQGAGGAGVVPYLALPEINKKKQ